MRTLGLTLVTLTLLSGSGASDASAQRLNRTIETLEAGHPAFGLFTANHSLINARSLAASDLDFLFIDMEHAPLDFERLQIFLLGMTDAGRIAGLGSAQMRVTPLGRISQYGSEQRQFIADGGAKGIARGLVCEVLRKAQRNRSLAQSGGLRGDMLGALQQAVKDLVGVEPAGVAVPFDGPIPEA